MNVKEAAKTALNHVADIFANEEPADLALEEVEFVPDISAWDVTVGFTRPWKTLRGITGFTQPHRDYKIVRINDETGQLVSIKIRRFSD